MGNEATNVSVGKPSVAGAVWIAPAGTELPTDAVTEINEAFKCLGYISDEGIKKAMEKSSEAIKAWGGDTVASPQTEFSDKFTIKFIEALNVNVLKAVYGDTNVSGDLEAGIAVKVNSQETDPASWIIDMIATANVLYRMVIPSGKITEVAEVEYADGTPIGYESTITAFPDSGGDYHHEYMQKKTTEASTLNEEETDAGTTDAGTQE